MARGHELRVDFVDNGGRDIQGRCLPLRLRCSTGSSGFHLGTIYRHRLRCIGMKHVGDYGVLRRARRRTYVLLRPRHYTIAILLASRHGTVRQTVLRFSRLRGVARQLSRGRCELRLVCGGDSRARVIVHILSFKPLLQIRRPTNFVRLLHRELHGRLTLQTGRWRRGCGLPRTRLVPGPCCGSPSL